MIRNSEFTPRWRPYVAVCLALLTVVAFTAAPAAAVIPWDDGDDDDEESLFEGIAGGAAGLAAEYIASFTNRINKFLAERSLTGEDGDAEAHAQEFKGEYNAANETIEGYVNERVNATEDREVFALRFSDREGGTATVYLVSEATPNGYENSRVVDEAEFEDLNRTVDATFRFDWYASMEAAGEVRWLVRERAGNDEDLSGVDRFRLYTEYEPSIESDLWGDDLNESDDDE